MMFQPSMLGVEQAGLAEVVEFILKKYPPEIQNSLVQVGTVVKLCSATFILSLQGHNSICQLLWARIT